MPIQLVVVAGNQVQKVPVTNTALLIGRSKDCQITVDDPLLNEKHCSFLIVDHRTFITDLCTQEGTFINEVAIKDSFVFIGDKIRIGNVAIYLDPSEMTDDEIRYHRPTENNENTLSTDNPEENTELELEIERPQLTINASQHQPISLSNVEIVEMLFNKYSEIIMQIATSLPSNKDRDGDRNGERETKEERKNKIKDIMGQLKEAIIREILQMSPNCTNTALSSSSTSRSRPEQKRMFDFTQTHLSLKLETHPILKNRTKRP